MMRCGEGRDAPGHLHYRVPAGSAYLRMLRSRLTDWSQRRGLSDEVTYGLAVATDEAMSNVIRHAYEDAVGVIDVQGTVVDCGRGLVVTITDYGRWREQMEGAPHGLGLRLIRGFCDKCEVASTKHGTVVRMEWRLPARAQTWVAPGPLHDGQAQCLICAAGRWTGAGFL